MRGGECVECGKGKSRVEEVGRQEGPVGAGEVVVGGGGGGGGGV